MTIVTKCVEDVEVNQQEYFPFQNRLWRNEVAHKRKLRAQEQTRKVKEILWLVT